jgi:hypothetical protein
VVTSGFLPNILYRYPPVLYTYAPPPAAFDQGLIFDIGQKYTPIYCSPTPSSCSSALPIWLHIIIRFTNAFRMKKFYNCSYSFVRSVRPPVLMLTTRETQKAFSSKLIPCSLIKLCRQFQFRFKLQLQYQTLQPSQVQLVTCKVRIKGKLSHSVDKKYALYRAFVYGANARRRADIVAAQWPIMPLSLHSAIPRDRKNCM